MNTQAPPHADQSLPDLLKQLTSDAALLVRQEIALARAELTQKIDVAIVGAAGFGAAALLGLGAFAALTVTLIALLALVLPLWAAALIVTAAYGGAAAVAALYGKSRMTLAARVPTHSAASLRDDARAVADGVRRGR